MTVTKRRLEHVPATIAEAGAKATKRYWEFFAANIRNRNTRVAYARALGDFFRWCEDRRVLLIDIEPITVAAFVEYLGTIYAKPTVKQHLAAIRMCMDWLVVGQVIPMNPASSVRGPKYVVKRGKTPVLSALEARALLDSIDTSTLIGLRDRAFIATLLFTFARVSAIVGMNVADYYQVGKRSWIRLMEKGGKHHEVPTHHTAEEYLDAYLNASGHGEIQDSPLFLSAAGKTGKLSLNRLSRHDALRMVTNGEQWMLVDAPKGETTGFSSWYASLWLEEPITLRAFRSLLSEGGNEIGVWHGKGAARLGLHGKDVNSKDFLNVLLGKSPEGKELRSPKCTKRQAKSKKSKAQAKKAVGEANSSLSDVNEEPNEVRAVDLTFSACKSFSIVKAMFELYDPEIARQMDQAYIDSVKDTMDFAERTLLTSRRGRNGAIRAPGELASAIFVHDLPRNKEYIQRDPNTQFSRGWTPEEREHLLAKESLQNPVALDQKGVTQRPTKTRIDHPVV